KLASPLRVQAYRLGDLLDLRVPTKLLEELPLGSQHPVDRVHDVDGHADRARLVGDGPRDRLADPPRGVGGELVAAGVVELFDRPDQPDVPFLDEVEQRQTTTGAPL